MNRCLNMERILLQGLLWMGCLVVVQSLVCNHCTGVSHPANCASTKVCRNSEICFTERVLRGRNEIFYNSGCMSSKGCRSIETKGVACGGERLCLTCCEKNKCNVDECHHSVRRRSCKEYKESGSTSSGVYTLDLGDGQPLFQVYCDMDTEGGGWTVFQRRKDGSEDFYRGWNDYKTGFGNLQDEFWLGNDYLHRLTKAGLSTLRVDLTDWEGNSRYAEYSTFGVGSEADFYRLTAGGYNGTAGDSFTGHSGFAFSTKDTDHDTYKPGSCARMYTGAWWYSNCHSSNLNGHYYTGGKAPYGKGVDWYSWKKHYYSLKSTEMKLREP